MTFSAALDTDKKKEETSMMKKCILFLSCLGFIFAIPIQGKCEALKREDISYNLGVFGNINYKTKDRDTQHHSFSLGELDLYGTANYERMSFLTELLIEFEGQAVELDMERIWIGYSFSDLFTLRAGRHHTSLGYWNRTYHHGKQLFVTVERPFIIAFEGEGGIIPAHIVGLEAEGRVSVGAINLKYELQVGNGPTISEGKLAPNNSSDDNPSKEWVARLSGTSPVLPGFTFGLSGTSFKITQADNTIINEKVAGLDVSYIRGELDLLGEVFRFKNSDKEARLGYVQAAYNISKYSVTPYVRHERMDVEDGDPYLDALGGRKDRTQDIAGARYDINERSSLKAQYRRDKEKSLDTKNVFEVQWAFAF